MSDWVARTPVKSGALKRGDVKQSIMQNGANSKKSLIERVDRPGWQPGGGLTPGLPTYELTAFACNAGSKIVKYAATDSR